MEREEFYGRSIESFAGKETGTDFRDGRWTEKTIAIAQPKEDVTKEAAEAAMQKVVDAGVFTTAKGDLAGIVGARMRTTDLEPLA